MPVTFITDHNAISERRVRFTEGSQIKHGSPIDLEGIPFVVAGHKFMECHQGPQRRKTTLVFLYSFLLDFFLLLNEKNASFYLT